MTEKRKAGRPSTIDSRRSEILQKATECFVLNGYNKTTLDQIGEALGFNKAALYYYFKDKEEIFRLVFQSSMLKLWDEIKTETLAAEGFYNKIEKYFEIKMRGWLMLLNINGISKENLINLNLSFAESIMRFRKSEIDFLKEIMLAENSNYTDEEIEEFINLLIDAQTDITMNGILLNDINKNHKKLEEIKGIKNNLLKYFLLSFKTSYTP